jgi:hypothetical protein
MSPPTSPISGQHSQPADTTTAPHHSRRLQRENAQLRSTNHDMAENLELAIANIQRLTVDNHHLRQQLETTTNTNITRIDTRHRPSPSISRPR